MELDKISEMVKSKQSYINTVSKVREGGRIRYRYGFSGTGTHSIMMDLVPPATGETQCRGSGVGTKGSLYG